MKGTVEIDYASIGLDRQERITQVSSHIIDTLIPQMPLIFKGDDTQLTNATIAMISFSLSFAPLNKQQQEEVMQSVTTLDAYSPEERCGYQDLIIALAPHLPADFMTSLLEPYTKEENTMLLAVRALSAAQSPRAYELFAQTIHDVIHSEPSKYDYVLRAAVHGLANQNNPEKIHCLIAVQKQLMQWIEDEIYDEENDSALIRYLEKRKKTLESVSMDIWSIESPESRTAMIEELQWSYSLIAPDHGGFMQFHYYDLAIRLVLEHGFDQEIFELLCDQMKQDANVYVNENMFGRLVVWGSRTPERLIPGLVFKENGHRISFLRAIYGIGDEDDKRVLMSVLADYEYKDAPLLVAHACSCIDRHIDPPVPEVLPLKPVPTEEILSALVRIATNPKLEQLIGASLFQCHLELAAQLPRG